jgi:hypothetical protein
MHPLATLPLLAALAFQAASPVVSLQSAPAKDKKAAVTYLFPEQVTIPAGKPSPVDLHFKVADGLHVNSHEPHAEDFIPTTLNVSDNTEVRLAAATFPPGKDFSFAINPQEKLSVYTGEFTVHATFIASEGEHLVQGTLHYQACNNAACFPPRSIPVVLDVIAK